MILCSICVLVQKNLYSSQNFNKQKKKLLQQLPPQSDKKEPGSTITPSKRWRNVPARPGILFYYKSVFSRINFLQMFRIQIRKRKKRCRIIVKSYDLLCPGKIIPPSKFVTAPVELSHHAVSQMLMKLHAVFCQIFILCIRAGNGCI